MAIQIKSLYKNQLGNAEVDLYGPGSGKAAIVKNIRLVNTGSSAVTVNLFVKRAALASAPGGGYRIIPKDMSLAPGAAFIEDSEVTLEYVSSSLIDLVRGYASAATTVDCVISGIERDVS
jgi:hypothetical protein